MDAVGFRSWSTQGTCGVYGENTCSWYEINQANVFTKLQDSEFAGGLPACVSKAEIDYKDACGASLFAFSRRPSFEWHRKPYASFAEKLYRINCVENSDFPNGPPQDGWVSLESSFYRVDDIVRTTMVVAYADLDDPFKSGHP